MRAGQPPNEAHGVAEAREIFDPGKPRLGGAIRPLPLAPATRRLLEAFADTLLPPSPPFPAPSATGLLDYVARYVGQGDDEPAHFPFVCERDLETLATLLGADFALAGPAQRTTAVDRLATEEPRLFAKQQALVYFGYYAQPEVARAIARSGDAAKDYHGPPQPYGYPDSMGDWSGVDLEHGRGGYIATDDVRPVSVERIGRSAEELVAPRRELSPSEPLPERTQS